MRLLSNQSQTNVDYLRSKINNKLTRQNTHTIISKESDKNNIHKFGKLRETSSSAPPTFNRKTALMDKTESKNKIAPKIRGTSSFASSRKMMLPIEYSNAIHNRYGVPSTSVVIERGAGRRTPISNILDKVTSIDKLWSAEKRNEQIDIIKASKSVSRTNNSLQNKGLFLKPEANVKSFSPSITHKSRDMIRTAEKVQKIKILNLHTKSNPCLATRNDQKINKSGNLQTASKISKSSLSLSSGVKKQNPIKTAVVTNLNKKKSLENVVSRPRVSPCHESCSKKNKDPSKNSRTKNMKSKCPKNMGKKVDLELSNQFGDISKETSNSGSLEKLYGHDKINAKENKHSREALVSHTFFQHLFLGKPYHQIVAYPLYEQNTTVLQKAKMFQSLPNDNNTPKLQNSYLIHRKPVSLSRFKIWDRHNSPYRGHSPRSVSWPGRIQPEIRKFDSLSKYENFGSTSSLATVRSKSEPPINKIYFSQTSRPKSPVVLFYNKEMTPEITATYSISPTVQKGTKTPIQVSCNKLLFGVMKQPLSPTKSILTETTRPISPVLNKRLPNLDITKKVINDNKSPSTILFSHKSKATSSKINEKPVLMNKLSRSNSTSPLPTRSPSCRRIHSARLQSSKHYDETPKLISRTRSAGDADNRLIFQDNMQLITKSDSNLHASDPDYDEYIRDIHNNKTRSERFRELNRYYTYLERVAELERATSACEVRHRRKDEEIVDFDRWKKIRAIERAEEELNNLHRKLKIAQDENDVLFYPRDLKDFRWNYERERGLRVKEKSVENLKDHFQQLSHFDSLELEQIPSMDTYKPLWRGTSVAETAFHINKLNEQKKNQTQLKIKPTLTLQTKTTLCDLRKRIGLGNRLWSSLSMDQVNALKCQLNAIYSKEFESKCNEKKVCDFYTVNVSGSKCDSQNSSLHVRCNSLVTTTEQEKPIKLSKSESIAAIPCPITSVKELKNNVNKIQMSLSENEKRKISQTLSKELLNRINKYDNENKLLFNEEIEDSKGKKYDEQQEDVLFTNQHFDEKLQESCTGSENIWDDKKRHVVYSNEKTEMQQLSSASETETASSDASNKTAIYREPSKEVKKKVDYFESVTSVSDSSKTVHQVKENTHGKENKHLEKKSISHRNVKPELQINQIVQSQSCTNIKEFFGESEKNKFLSLPLNPKLQSRSLSPHSALYIADRQTPDTLRFSSDETIWRSRSPSPDPERYWRAYINLAQRGDVRRLVQRFDSPTPVGTILRRHRSDPEIARNVLDKNWSFLEKLSPRRDKCKVMLPVARVPLRTTNRFMPHIDIISKLASLRRRTAPRSRSAEEALECRPGEVDRIRRRFEAMSLLGHVYTSAPDVTELHDIAPYLAGSWIAHRYPKPSDNNRSVNDPSSLVHGHSSPIRKDSTLSTPKESVRLSSILKIDTLAKEKFDPSLHRPVSRYEPPRAPPRPPPASWPQRLSPYITSSRHTVTFQETNSVPEPPRRALHGSYSDTESPRRYVESDVNIHYRCPVRHDPLPLVPERELARQQAEHMKRLYREQRRTKYLQELQDMQNRRHQDNFTPSQKSVVPLNRYDEANKITAKALYTFNGQTPRELSFRKGEIIHVRRQIDANWYEGEVHGKIGLFPYNYVEIQKCDTAPKKPTNIEGRARAKFDFIAQTNLELPLKKGEVVVLSRRIDQNWWEGRNGDKTGIFPDSYVTVLQEPTHSKPEPKPILSTDKPVASPAAHGLLNGTDKRSMGSHSYTPQPNSPALANAPPATQPLPGYVAKPAQATLTPSDRGYGPPTGPGVDLNNAEPLYVDTNAEAVPYRAMYKYRPQNPDELELQEGDTVYVLEKCDDGWYVGSSQRTGRFGTFPGNYVERI